MLKRALLCSAFALLLAAPVEAQSTADRAVIGYMSSSPQPNCTGTQCFVQYGATLPTSGGGGGGAITGPLGPTTAPSAAVATTDTGTPITGQTIPTGGQGTIGWLSALFSRLPALGSATSANSTPVVIASDQGAIGQLSSQLPAGATAVNNSGSNTTTAAFTSLAATANVTNYLCGYSIDADATAATAGTATIAGLISNSLLRRQAVGAALATITTSQTFNPCLPASGVNVAISVTSVAAGVGGNTTVSIWGYRK